MQSSALQICRGMPERGFAKNIGLKLEKSVVLLPTHTKQSFALQLAFFGSASANSRHRCANSFVRFFSFLRIHVFPQIIDHRDYRSFDTIVY
jgi:hypothetical protein